MPLVAFRVFSGLFPGILGCLGELFSHFLSYFFGVCLNVLGYFGRFV